MLLASRENLIKLLLENDTVKECNYSSIRMTEIKDSNNTNSVSKHTKESIHRYMAGRNI